MTDRAELTPDRQLRGLRASLANGQSLLATFSIIPTPEVCDLICVAGFDAVIIDMEHSTHSRRTVEFALTVAASRGVPAVVRVPDGTPATIQAVLDSGADAVLVPQVTSAQEARAAVAAARFAPEGRRGVNPWVRAARYGADENWLTTANSAAAVIVMVEGGDAIEQIDEILQVPGLDAVFLGPVDLAASMGLGGQPNHPRVVAAMSEIIAKADASGVAVAAFAPDVERARDLRRQGVRLIACLEDTALFLTALRQVVDAMRD
ncbi:aldolase/citrate lyase family protein [Dactylosporangium sp. AC04546]|uniref:HpcH/HpaI aldolase family protein n=1 Tax=Dactylosporangium sp. AC04546 TaxID=2862460 RepID=UPI001EE0CB3E|nr:aldolase/citrate lyase family protein [Dactylosporangium sp. AC04546]WVK86841.1 aldolase/citrate lyase family protein [Dactylosporangium sp. AC04546]